MTTTQKSALALGVFLLCVAAVGAIRGVHGPTGNTGLLGSDVAGVYGEGLNGVEGHSTDGNGTGVQGVNTSLGGFAVKGSGGYTGVFGETTQEVGAGVWGIAAPLDGAAAVYGNAAFPAWAGYFDGDVHINGKIEKASGSFKIDHPLDPANKYLSHSFVESPDMKNIYDGVVRLGGDGTAVVELPDYFEALNRDFRYQLTCIGGHAPIYIAREIREGQFKIAGGTAGLKVSWQVTGIR
ncbi:MAG TPA: hypothetical protein VF698_20200, partial [Thermoanaerobaculia bacterium]